MIPLDFPHPLRMLAIGVGVVATITIGVMAWRLSVVRSQLEACASARALAEQRAASLAAALDEQNAAVDQLRRRANTLADALADARRQAEQERLRAERDVGRLDAIPVPADEVARCKLARDILTGQALRR